MPGPTGRGSGGSVMTLPDQFGARPEVGPAVDLTSAVIIASPGWVLLLDGDLRIIAASAAFCSAFGLDVRGVVGRPCLSLDADAWESPELRRLLEAAARDAPPEGDVTFDLRRPGRQPRRLVAHAERLVHADEIDPRLLLSFADVAEGAAVDSDIEALRRTAALLLREARHRISNGLQIIATILLRSARIIEPSDARGHLQAAYSRVMAVAALERRLSDASGQAVPIQLYLTELCEHLIEAAIADPARVSLRYFIDDVVVAAATAPSLGMVMIELIVNALKHAFPDERPGNVTVSFDAEGADWTLRVADNGVGMPETPVPGGLGTEIVAALARQLGAGVEVSNAFPGKIVSVSYSDRSPAAR